MADNIHVNDIGTIFRLTMTDSNGVVLDISGATTQEIVFEKPDGTLLTKTSVFTNTGTDGKMQYLSVSGDLNSRGIWHLQGHVILPGGEWRSSRGHFEVLPNL